MIRSIVFVALATLCLTACAEGTSIYHDRTFKPGFSAVTVDAKQRSAFVAMDSTGKAKVCAEASPDVFSALSGSGSLGIDVKSQNGNAGLSIAETAATIERTQTINMLREAMYRTCERYFSGAYAEPLTVIQAARDQQTMLRTLAVEQLTRTIRPPATVISPPGTSASAVSPAAVALVTDLGDERRVAKTAADEASTAFDKAQAAAKAKGVDCATVKDEPKEDDKKKLWADCNDAKNTSDKKAAEFAAASQRFDNAVTALGNSGSTGASASTKPSNSDPGGHGEDGPSDVAIASVSAAVRDIVTTPTLNEALMFCLSFLQSKGSDAGTAVDAQTRLHCYDILKARDQADIKLLSYAPDAAGKTMLAYLGDIKVSKAENQRRLALARQASADLKISDQPIDIMARVEKGDPTNVALLATMISKESDPAGKAILQAK